MTSSPLCYGTTDTLPPLIAPVLLVTAPVLLVIAPVLLVTAPVLFVTALQPAVATGTVAHTADQYQSVHVLYSDSVNGHPSAAF